MIGLALKKPGDEALALNSLIKVFIDQTGFRLQPVNRCTWAPRGETPAPRAGDRYDRLSVVGAVAL